MTIIQDIHPRTIASAYLEKTPLGQAIEEFEKNNYHIASLKEIAGLRIQEGKDSDVSTSRVFASEGLISFPDGGYFLTRKSPIIANPEQVANCLKKRDKFYLTNKQVEEALENSFKLKGVGEILTFSFGLHSETRNFFEEYAVQYGGFLNKLGIERMPIHFDTGYPPKERPYVRPVFLKSIASSSEIYAGELKDIEDVRGILNT
ncbi:MAG: hypothetical protein WC438_03065 [Candidatus Pacearchaeota archaeon]